MFVSSGQIYVFLACFAVGGVSGIFLSVSRGVKYLIKNKIVAVISDITAFLAITLSFIGLSFAFGFPNIRAYMPLGVFLGVIAYMKSFHIILAKLTIMIYNYIITHTGRIIRNANDRRKTKKINSRRRSRRGAFGSDTAIDNGLSVDSDRG